MSALGQKQTYAVHKAMSALPPKADIRILITCDWASSGLDQFPRLPPTHQLGASAGPAARGPRAGMQQPHQQEA
jgi:hypothetical protein